MRLIYSEVVARLEKALGPSAAGRIIDSGTARSTLRRIETRAAGDAVNRLRAMIEGDRIDYRAMQAIEVYNEQNHRIYADNPGTPADRVELWGDTALREEIEALNGEPLA